MWNDAFIAIQLIIFVILTLEHAVLIPAIYPPERLIRRLFVSLPVNYPVRTAPPRDLKVFEHP